MNFAKQATFSIISFVVLLSCLVLAVLTSAALFPSAPVWFGIVISLFGFYPLYGLGGLWVAMRISEMVGAAVDWWQLADPAPQPDEFGDPALDREAALRQVDRITVAYGKNRVNAAGQAVDEHGQVLAWPYGPGFSLPPREWEHAQAYGFSRKAWAKAYGLDERTERTPAIGSLAAGLAFAGNGDARGWGKLDRIA